MKVIVGLGNPGARYASTRHNVGFMALDFFKEQQFPGQDWGLFRGADVLKSRWKEEPLWLVKPREYMNLSGRSLKKVLQNQPFHWENTLVIQDELDLDFGKLRLKQGGSARGHNGLKDIIQQGGQSCLRIRIGIDHPGDIDKVHDHVLSSFSSQEAPSLETIFLRVDEGLSLWLEGDTSQAQNHLRSFSLS